MKKFLLVVLSFVIAFMGVYAQNRTVKGKVTDAKGAGLPGVTVTAGKKSTTTDASGNYSIALPDGVTKITFKSIGFKETTETVNSSNLLNVSMIDDASTMEEVVVNIGITSVSKQRSATAVSTIKAKDLSNVPVANINEALQGRAPGLTVNTASGQPGSTQQVRVRGIGSISAGAAPLYVIDGVIIDRGNFTPSNDAYGGANGQQSSDILATLNFNDVESVNVLKDAAALALYGSRGANGVIVINTKKGQSGTSKTSFRAQYGVSEASFGNWQMMTPAEIIQYETDVLALNGSSAAAIAALYPNRDSMINNAFNWIDAAYRRGITKSIGVSTSGGNEKTTHYVSFDYYNQDGVLIASGLERYAVQANVSHKATKKLTLGFNGNFGYTNTLNGNAGNRFASPLLGSFVNSPVWSKAYDPVTGQLYTGREPGANLALTQDNFLYNSAVNFNRAEQFRSIGKFNVNYKFADWLKFEQITSIDMVWARDKTFQHSQSGDGFADGGSVEGGSTYNLSTINQSRFTGNFKVGKEHNFDYLAGIEYQRSTFESLYAIGNGLANNNIKLLDGTGTPNYTGGDATEFSFFGMLSQLNYSYKGKYSLTGSFRRDGSSRFGSNFRLANFWSVGGSWQIAKEKFLSNSKWINDLKLRVSYGTAGNADFSNFTAAQLYGSGAAYTGQAGLAPSTIGNNNLTWELSKTWNAGVDFALFNSRVSGSFNVYERNTSQLLQNLPVSSTSGFTTAQINLGSIRNRGIEITLNAEIVNKKHFTWNTEFNAGYNKNEVTELQNNADIIVGTQIRRVGQPINSFFARKWGGVNPVNGDPQWRMLNGSLTRNYNAADRDIAGIPYPLWTYGLTNTWTYKNLSLSMFMYAQTGNTIFNQTKSFVDSDGQRWQWNYHRDAGRNYWRKPGDVAERPRPVVNGNPQSNSFSTRYLEDGKFLRIRNITMGYNLPKSAVSFLKISNARFYVTAQNLITFTNYSGVDPEVDITGNEFFKYPVPKTYLIGLDITF